VIEVDAALNSDTIAELRAFRPVISVNQIQL